MPELSFRKSIVLSILVLTLVLILFAVYIPQHKQAFDRILNLDLLEYAVLSALVVAGVFNNGLMVYHFLKSMGIRLHMREWLSLSALTTAGNQLLFRGGAIAKAFYLKKIHTFAYSRFIPIMGAQLVITLFAVGIMGLFGLAWMFLASGFAELAPFLVFLCVVAAPLAVLLLTPGHLPEWLAHNRYVTLMFDSWNRICRDRSLLTILTILSIVNILLYVGRLYAAFHFTGSVIPFMDIYIIALLGILSEFIGIVPGGLGVKEAVVGFSAELYGGQIKEGVVAASLDRAVLMAWVSVMGGIALIYLVGHRKQRREQSTGDKQG